MRLVGWAVRWRGAGSGTAAARTLVPFASGARPHVPAPLCTPTPLRVPCAGTPTPSPPASRPASARCLTPDQTCRRVLGLIKTVAPTLHDFADQLRL
eukprot:380915-Rhodomonas_salina.1